jgi:two-component system sensor histidine kinase and response regulator WspE
MAGYSMLDLFRMEVETQAAILNENLSVIETQPASSQELEALMRAAHSIKGAARIVELDAAVNLAHVMEDCFVAAQNQKITLGTGHVDVLLRGVDLLQNITQVEQTELDPWLSEHNEDIETIQKAIAALLVPGATPVSQERVAVPSARREQPPATKGVSEANLESPQPAVPPNQPTADSALDIAAEMTPETPREEPAPPPINTQETSPAVDEVASVGNISMLELFRLEVDAQAGILNEGLLALEANPQSPKELEALMRAAHSIKGAARIVALDAAVKLAHVMEDCFVAAQAHTITLGSDDVDVLLGGADLLLNLSQVEQEELNHWLAEHNQEIQTTQRAISAILTPGAAPISDTGGGAGAPRPQHSSTPANPEPQKQAIAIALQESAPSAVATADIDLSTQLVSVPARQNQTTGTLSVPSQTQATATKELVQTTPSTLGRQNQPAEQPTQTKDRDVRVSAENLNRIMGLAGESLIEANWLQPFADSLVVLKKRQMELSKILENLQDALNANKVNQESENHLKAARAKERECREVLGDRLQELELFARRTGNLSDRLYREVIASNMRPFVDGVQGFPRMIRDLSRNLGKKVTLNILGKATPVDRDILKKLEAPLTHILRNAVDHGIELPDERRAKGKPEEGTIRLEAVHRGGMLSVTITDDGKGIDPEQLRQKVINKSLASPEMAAKLTEGELMEFLFLPGFSTAKQVTEISGRGVGLDIAMSMAQEVGGTVRATSQPGKGMNFHFQLPLTLSVIRTLLVEIANEPYAFPLARIDQIVMVEKSEISVVENRQYFTLNGEHIGLVAAHQVLELPETPHKSEELSVVVISDQSSRFGIVVDQFLGERDLVVRPLDPRLGKVQDIGAAALMGDGTPILIVDVADLVRSIDNWLNTKEFHQISSEAASLVVDDSRSILVVDDSITVREMERKMLLNKGYKVDVAVDGMDGWNAVRTNRYDLVVSDIDMPRMTGIELVSLIKSHPKLNKLPIIIVSYKDREEDRVKGMEAGADYYLTKSSFQDESFMKAVEDLIGSA